MNHKKVGRKFGREKDQRKAFLKALAVNLISHGKIKTTDARAKEMRALVERLITRAKKDDPASRRLVLKFIPQIAAQKLIKEIAPKYLERKGGYTRITKIGNRKSDGAPISIIELL